MSRYIPHLTTSLLLTVLLLAGCASQQGTRDHEPPRNTSSDTTATTPVPGDPSTWPTSPPKERRQDAFPQSVTDAVAPTRFVFEKDGFELAMPARYTHDLTKGPYPELRRLIIAIPGAGKGIMGQFDRWAMRAEQEGVAAHTWVVGLQYLNPRDYIAHGIGDDHRSLYWDEQDWPLGYASASFPEAPRPARISSYAVIDTVIAYALRAAPNLETVIVTGNSAGGNITQRYAPGTTWPEQRPDIHWGFVTSNMGMFMYLNDDRGITSEDDPDRFAFETMDRCETGLEYPFGLRDLNPYLARKGADEIRRVYPTRNIVYTIGTLDTKVEWYTEYCWYQMQGRHRYERHLIWRHYLEHMWGPGIYTRQRVYEMPGLAHDEESWGRPVLRHFLYHWVPGVDELPVKEDGAGEGAPNEE